MPQLELDAVKRTVTSLLALMILTSHPSLAAQTRIIQDCGSCSGELEMFVRLGQATGPGYLGRPSSVTRRVNGGWLVTDYYDTGSLKYFTADGRFVKKVGRRGKGPGDYELLAASRVLPGDTVEVVDFSLARISTLSPRLEYVRSRQIEGGSFNSLAFLDDGWVAIGATRIGSARIGLPVHLVAPDGSLTHSFGADPPIEDLTDLDGFRRTVSGSHDGGVWVAETVRYSLGKWNRAGQLVVRAERVVPWFPPGDNYGRNPDPTIPPGAGIFTIRVDSSGLLWVLIHVPQDNFRDALTVVAGPRGQPMPRVLDYNDFMDSVVEVIDPETLTVVRRFEHDKVFWGFGDDGILFALTTTDEGYEFVDIYRVR